MMVNSSTDPNYRRCAISLMDNIADPDISFDANGVCNYAHEYAAAEAANCLKGAEGEAKVASIVEMLKRKGRGRKYDCIIGVSGGIDSTYLALQAKKFGLRALCVHFDNGWNSELAVKNIENIVSRCGFELYTYVIDWDEFRDIQLAYFKAGVIDIEAVTDVGIFDALDMICSQFDVGFILDGRNTWTEHTLPPSWINKNPNNLYNIHQKFGKIPLDRYPAKFRNGKYVRPKGSFTSIPLLNYMDYNKKLTKERIAAELGWRDYGGKHYESVFTRFYQGHILPVKFKVDKRKAHLSNLIFSGQITLEQAQAEIAQPIYPEGQLEIDRGFVLKKLGFSSADFDQYLNAPPVPHAFYGGDPVTGQKTLYTKVRMELGRIKQKLLHGK